jgi:hypothetical protein
MISITPAMVSLLASFSSTAFSPALNSYCPPPIGAPNEAAGAGAP